MIPVSFGARGSCAATVPSSLTKLITEPRYPNWPPLGSDRTEVNELTRLTRASSITLRWERAGEHACVIEVEKQVVREQVAQEQVVRAGGESRW